MIEILERPVIPRKVELYPPPLADSVLYFPGYPPKSSTIEDRHGGTAHDGTITGASWKRLPSGLWYLDFDGTDDKITVAHHADFNFAEDDTFSLIAWIRTEDKSGAIISKGMVSPAYRGYELHVDASGYPRVNLNSTYATDRLEIYVATAINDGVWHLVGFTYNASPAAASCAFYVDGVSKTVVQATDTLDAGEDITVATALCFGDRSAGGYVLDFDLALPDICDAVLDSTEMTFIYQWQRKWFGV